MSDLKERPVRVRFGPSPTGAGHIGSLRTALFNYVFAKKHGGEFILRIEDTDQKRFVFGAEDYIMRSLNWLGITPDEHPLKPGDCGPYRQSARKDLGIYAPFVSQLLDAGYAYYAFDTDEELEQMRLRQENLNVKSGYNYLARKSMKNSLTLPSDDVAERLKSKQPYVIRLKVPEKEQIRFHDLIRGWIMVETKDIDDKVLMKSGGMPAYHLANVVDDHLMRISHVIRGEEWLPSAPFHVLLYKYLGWEESMPEFAHLPLLMGPNGKISKRDGDKLGFPLFPLSWNFTMPDGTPESITGYKESGYDPDALFNFLSLMGWNPGGTDEVMTREEVIEKFDLSRVNKSGCLVDFAKLKHFQSVYFKKQDKEEMFKRFYFNLASKGFMSVTIEKARKVFEMAFERSSFEHELLNDIEFFFEAPVASKEFITGVDEKVFNVLTEFSENISSDVGVKIKETLFETIKKNGMKNVQVLKPLRFIITGHEHGPELHNIFDALGKEEIVTRIKNAKQLWNSYCTL